MDYKVRHKNKKSAFSLIELSIIVVIIAIIVASISQGSKLIESTKIKSVISEVQTILHANNTFQLTYKKLAGDMNNAYDFFGPQNCGGGSGSGTKWACNGSGNNLLSADGSGGYYREEHIFWEHLYYSGIMTHTAPVGNGTTVYISNNIKGLNISAQDIAAFNEINGLRLGKQRADKMATKPEQTYNNQGKTFTPLQAYQIDKKLDDGVADTGSVLGINGYDDASVISTVCKSGSEYDLLQDTAECYIHIELELLYD